MNYLAILICVILNFVIARIWYGTIFNKQWRALTNRTPDERPSSKQMAIAVVFALIMSVGVNFLVNLFTITRYSLATTAAVIACVMIIAPLILSEWIWDKKKIELVLINAGFYIIYFFASLLVFVALR